MISTTREGRFGERAGAWVLATAAKRADATFRLVDLRDYPLGFFNEPIPPSRRPPEDPVARRLGDTMGECDGFIFVTAEYNHGIPAVLKNAIDHLYPEMNRKPASFVGYGSSGAIRAIEQLRMNLIELKMAPLQSWLGMSGQDFRSVRTNETDFADFPQWETGLAAMLDDLLWWTRTLAAGRNGR